ncbi:MAG: Uma2 family endonuclease [Caldilineaceae bacterium]|nr:Uma2 family endonuclease [Caldilineaceae bacterium]
MSYLGHSPAPIVGRRQIVTYNTTAQPSYTTRDLTPGDFLDPQPGDEFFHGDAHGVWVEYLARGLRHLYRYSPAVGVLVGTKIAWEDRSLAQPAPDLAVAAGLADPRRRRDLLDAAAEGTRPRFILEVTSPALAQIDLVDKVALYGRAGVQEYFIVQPAARPGPAALSLLAYRLDQGVYTPVAPDAPGRFYSATNRIWFVVDLAVAEAQPADPTHSLRLVEERTGRAITPPAGETEPDNAIQVDAALRAQSIAAKLNLGR